MIQTLLLGAALAASGGSSSVVVRVDDRKARLLEAPAVTLFQADGTTQTVPATDDGVDPADQFANDRIWVARFTVAGSGEALIYVNKAADPERFQPVARSRVSYGGRSALVQVSVPTEEEIAAAEKAASETPALEGDFPVAQSALELPEAPDLRGWDQTGPEALVAVLGLVALVWGLVGSSAARARRALVGTPEPVVRSPAWPGRLALGAGAVLLGSVWLPPLPRIARDFLGIEYVDHYGTQWFYWFVEYAWRTGTGIDRTDRFFFPWGKDIYSHTGANVLDAWAALPLRALLGPVLGYNVFILVMQAMSGVAFYLLARYLVRDRVAAGLAAVLYTLQPFILLEFQEGRPTQGITLLPVLFLAGLLVSGLRPGLLAPIAGGVALALTGYQYWYYAIFGSVLALAHGLWLTAYPPPGAGGARRVFGRHVVMAAVAAALVAPAVLPMLQATMGDDAVPGMLDVSLWSLVASPPTTREGLDVGIYSWQPLRRAMGFLVVDDDGNELFLAQNVAFPAVLYLGLVLWLRRPLGPSRGPTLAMLATLIVIAVGPVWIVGDLALPNVVYIYLVKAVGLLQRLWWPSRALGFVVMLLSLVLAGAMAWLRTQGSRTQLVGFSVLLLGWTMALRNSGLLPFPSWSSRVPAGYQCLAQKGQDGAIIELPFAWTQAHLYFQTVHERPILGGMLEDNETFTPEEFTSFRTTQPMVKNLLGGDPTTFDWDDAAEVEVGEMGYTYVVVQKDPFYRADDPEGRDRLALLLLSLESKFSAPVFEDARVAIFAPWGAPSPCVEGSVTPDNAPAGHTEQMQQIRELDRQRQVYHRWLTPPPEDAVEE